MKGIMYSNPRPSKIVFRRLLNRVLVDAEPYQTVLDCGSAGAKNRHLFSGKEYHGVDIDRDLIEKARRNHREDNTAFFYHDDIVDFQSEVTKQTFDLVICTHTLAHISSEDKIKATKNLPQRVEIGGSLILQCLSDDVKHVQNIQDCFTTVSKWSYRGLLSRVYEGALSRLFGTDCIGGLGTLGRVSGYNSTRALVLGGAVVLSWLDRLGPHDRYLYYLSNKRNTI